MFFKHRKSLLGSMLALSVAALLCAAPASAQSITVGGQIIFENSQYGTMALFGENFTFHAILPSFPLSECRVCLPGTVKRVGWEWEGQTFGPAEVTYNGQTFSPKLAMGDDGYGGIDILGFITVPELVGTLATVTVPFSLEGFVYTPESFRLGSTGRIGPILFGQGTVTVTFRREEESPSWRFGGAIYTLPFSFTGFFSPVDNDPTINTVKAGAGVPVKFSLEGDQGLNIFQAGFPVSQPTACDAVAVLASVEETVAVSQGGLTYDALADQYTYVWNTQKTWATTCRQLVLRLVDGSLHIANFQFR